MDKVTSNDSCGIINAVNQLVKLMASMECSMSLIPNCTIVPTQSMQHSKKKKPRTPKRPKTRPAPKKNMHAGCPPCPPCPSKVTKMPKKPAPKKLKMTKRNDMCFKCPEDKGMVVPTTIMEKWYPMQYPRSVYSNAMPMGCGVHDAAPKKVLLKKPIKKTIKKKMIPKKTGQKQKPQKRIARKKPAIKAPKLKVQAAKAIKRKKAMKCGC